MLFISLGFRFLGVPRTQAFLRRWSAAPGLTESNGASGIDIIRSGRRALAMVKGATGFGGTCLSRSFALWALLRRRGVETDLRIGYRKHARKIEGHAWLEWNGTPVNETRGVIGTYTQATHTTTFDTPQDGKQVRWT